MFVLRPNGNNSPSTNIEVNWDQYYPVASRISLIDLEVPFPEDEIQGAIFSLGADKSSGVIWFQYEILLAFFGDTLTGFCRHFSSFSMKAILISSDLIEHTLC